MSDVNCLALLPKACLRAVDAVQADSFSRAVVHYGYCVAVTDANDLALPDNVSIDTGLTKGKKQCRDDKNPNQGESFQSVLLVAVAVSKRHPILATEVLRLNEFCLGYVYWTADALYSARSVEGHGVHLSSTTFGNCALKRCI